MRVQPDPVPPRHTFEDDSSSDGEDDVSSSRQVSGYQDNDDPDVATQSQKKTESATIKVNLTEDIQDCAATVIGVELLHGVSQWFGEATQVGDISITTETDNVSLPIQYHQEDDIYTLSIVHQPPLPAVSDLALKILDALHPTNLVVLTSSTAVPSNIPISLLKTSHRPTAVGGLPADTNPLFSNRGRTSREDIQARIRAAAHPHESTELPLLQPPNMIQGVAAKLMELAEVHGIRATAFVFSTWVGEGLEKRDVEKVVGKLEDLLRGAHIDADDILKSWKKAVGSSAAEKSSIYL